MFDDSFSVLFVRPTATSVRASVRPPSRPTDVVGGGTKKGLTATLKQTKGVKLGAIRWGDSEGASEQASAIATSLRDEWRKGRECAL